MNHDGTKARRGREGPSWGSGIPGGSDPSWGSGIPGGSGGRLGGLGQALVGLLLITCMVGAMGLQPRSAEAAVTREVVTISQDAASTQSAAATLGYDATIASALLVVPTDCTSTTHTLIVNADCGSVVGEIQQATQTITSTGTVSATSLTDLPVAGTTRIYVQSTAAEASDRTYYLLIFYTR